MNTLRITDSVATFGNIVGTYTRDARETPWGINRCARFSGRNGLATLILARAYNSTLPRPGEVIRVGNDHLVVDGYTSLGD